ncbi:Choline/Carnitine o-acyltransferase-domain-containing protein [Infundibulicybe gibba]|nr:Choline/Carnitine o-acyltransferase-domain-containing protein [Infundibulicybe gibba]
MLKISRTTPRIANTMASLHRSSSSSTTSNMLRYQQSLPNLPVPPLPSTLSKYLASVKPHLTPAEFARTQSVVSSFLSSPAAATLQKRLQERASAPGVDSWLSDWWNEAAYMGYRDPVVVFVSYFYVHTQQRFGKPTAPERAAGLIKGVLAFRDMLESGRLEPEKARDTPLCMDSYKWMFHASRYPAQPSDTAKKFNPATNNHLICIRKNRFYVVPLVGTNGQEISYDELNAQFAKIIQKAGAESHPVPLGALTSDNRDNWFHARNALINASGPQGTNLANLEKIASSMIVVCLDDTAPVTREQTSWGCWVGDGRGRWYDKHQLIVYENGRSGFLGEHSCMDGTPTLRMNEFVLAGLEKGIFGASPFSTAPKSTLADPEELVFDINDEVKSLVKDAERRFDTLVGEHDLQVLHYESYGKSFTKQFKVSPDAWAQLVKQLAFFKMFNRPGVTYESAQTRKFKKGRTEVIRSSSAEARAWCESMLDANTNVRRHRAALFRTAAAKHVEYATQAADGLGLFTDPAFARTSHWELSTSQLSSRFFDGWGYGEVVPDGYGLSYSIGDEYIRWTITSKKRRTAELKHYLAEAATEVRGVMQRAAALEKEKKAHAEKAKL